MLRRIVVPLDGSRFGEQVLPLATELAERHRAELELVHVFEALAPYLVRGAPPIDPEFDIEMRRSRQAYLDQIADRLRTSSSVEVATTTLDGTEVVSTLAEYLADRHADLVIVTTHG